MNKIFNVDRFYNLFMNSPKKIVIISFEYEDEIGLHNMTIKIPCELIEFQAINEECMPSEYIYISSNAVDICTKTPFPMIIRINKPKVKKRKE